MIGTPSRDPADAAPAARLDEALARCYRHLGDREHSAFELRRKLERAGVTAAVTDEALAIVIEQGYVNDARYARQLVEDRRGLDGWGAERIRARLKAAGIDRELIEEALAGHDELAAAGELLRRRFPDQFGDDRERQRAFGMLIRLGYDSDLAYEAIRASSR